MALTDLGMGSILERIFWEAYIGDRDLMDEDEFDELVEECLKEIKQEEYEKEEYEDHHKIGW